MNIAELFKSCYKPPTSWIEKTKDTEYAFWDDGILYITFQGSFSKTDWIYNLMFWHTLGFHTGIYKKFNILKHDIDNIVKHKKIVLLGHSQGAGIALLTHLYLKRKGYNVTSYLFGCPKILSLWRYFAERKYTKDIIQYKVVTDIVTYISPVCIQAGKIIKLGDKKPIWKWKTSDHYPSEYRKYL